MELGALWSIVVRLADGNFHSGEVLGEVLGVSRAAVWKHIQRLENFGVTLSSVRGRGYCIPGGLDLLNQAQICSGLQSSNLDVQVFPQLDSTNSFLMRQENPAKRACFAEFQSAGRGRRGRVWVSPMAQNLYCSIGWEFESGVAAIEGLSLAIGVAIARTLTKVGATGLSLKWPNDVLYQDKKLAGILIEMTGDPAGHCRVVIGVGLNVSMRAQQAGLIEQPWIALDSILDEQAVTPVSRNQLATALLNELVNVLGSYQMLGFAYYQAEWMASAAHKGCRVELRNGKSILEGRFIGVTETGALRLDTASGEQIFHGGEISLRVEP